MAGRHAICRECLHARVRLGGGEAEAYCELGHGTPRKAYLLTRSRYPKSFRQAEDCSGYTPAEEKPLVD